MAYANRGVASEKKVRDYLELWQAQNPHREFNRLTDSKAAGRIIKSAAADFEYFTLEPENVHGLIEVKETEHEYRLARDKVPQLPRLRKREKCGGTSVVLIFHSTLKLWRAADIQYLATTGDKGSWNVGDLPTFASCELALRNFLPEVFK